MAFILLLLIRVSSLSYTTQLQHFIIIGYYLYLHYWLIHYTMITTPPPGTQVNRELKQPRRQRQRQQKRHLKRELALPNFSSLTLFHSIFQVSNFSGVDSKGLYLSSEKEEKELLSCVHVLYKM